MNNLTVFTSVGQVASASNDERRRSASRSVHGGLDRPARTPSTRVSARMRCLRSAVYAVATPNLAASGRAEVEGASEQPPAATHLTRAVCEGTPAATGVVQFVREPRAGSRACPPRSPVPRAPRERPARNGAGPPGVSISSGWTDPGTTRPPVGSGCQSRFGECASANARSWSSLQSSLLSFNSVTVCLSQVCSASTIARR